MKTSARRRARMAGILIQSAVLGTLLFWSVMRLVIAVSAARVFRYEGF